jgi:hypothetical protein
MASRRQPEENLPADVQVHDAGSIVLLAPLTDTARDWFIEHLPEDCPTIGVNYAIERRYVGDILEGINEAGMRLSLPGRRP